jgi:hypothetical protein
MSKQKVIVLAVHDQHLTVTEAARRYGVSRRWVHELLRREATGGIGAVEPRSRKPHTNPRRTGDTPTARIVSLRRELQTAGLDAGRHVLMLIHDTDVTISDTTTGEVIRQLTIDPAKNYQPRNTRTKKNTPGPKTGGVTDDSTHP